MSSRPLLVAVLLLLSLNTLAQQATPRVVPLPYDPLELATGPTAVPNTPEKRALLLNFLERARQNNAMHAPGTTPFSMKVSFNSIAPNSATHSHNGGYGEVEETWLSATKWRWSARLGDYSQLRIFYNGAAYDDKPRGSMPLRLQMVRNAVFWPLVGDLAASLIRVATAKWEGIDVACILTSGRTNDATDTPGRRWEETEYCIDPKSGLLRTLSEAPGIYTVYDYSGGMQFHGRTLARQITVVEGGTTVLQIHLDSIEEVNSDPSQFVPTHKMTSHGPGAVMVGPFRFSETVNVPSGYSGTVECVIIHAILDEKGRVLDAEATQSSDPTLAAAALGIVWRSTHARGMRAGKLQREAFINVKFSSPQ